MEDKIISDLYWKLKRENTPEGSVSEAIRTHSQVCGLLAYIFNCHPDTIAVIVKEEMK